MSKQWDKPEREESGRRLRSRVELVLLFCTAGISVVIAILDLSGILDANSWVAARLPALTLLCVGFVAGYLVVERRGQLDDMSTLIEQRTDAILRAMGGEVTAFKSSGDLVSAFAARVRTAKRIDDVTWLSGDVGLWSADDRALYGYLEETIDDVSKKRDVVWREVRMFLTRSALEQEKKRIGDPDRPGYCLGYYDVPSSATPPRIGFAVVDSGDTEGEVFLSSSDSRLRIQHPAVVDYFAQYFKRVWERAKKLEHGTAETKELLKELEEKLE